MSNSNHPKKGQSITVEPIRSFKDIRRVKRRLKNNPRDLLLFTIGINNGLRIGDLLKLTFGDVIDLRPGEILTIREQKTGKPNVPIPMNSATDSEGFRPPVPRQIGHLVGAKRRWYFVISQNLFY